MLERFTTLNSLHAMMDSVRELRDHRREDPDDLDGEVGSLTLHEKMDYFGTRARVQDHPELVANILLHGFGFDGKASAVFGVGNFFVSAVSEFSDPTSPPEVCGEGDGHPEQTILSFLNQHPDLVEKYVASVFRPSDLGRDAYAVLNQIWTVGREVPASGYLFCFGKKTVPVKFTKTTPADIKAATTTLQAGLTTATRRGLCLAKMTWL